MGSKIQIDFHFPKWAEALASRENELMLFIAAQLQTNRGMMFDTNNASRATPWQKPMLRDGQPLSLSGALRKSFAPTNDGKRPGRGPDGIVSFAGDSVTIGTKIAYAGILNTGGVIRPKRFPVLWIPIPAGKANSAMAPTKTAKNLIKGAKAGPSIRAAEKALAAAAGRYERTGNAEHKEKMVELRGKIKTLEGHKTGAPVVRGRNGKYYLLAKQAKIPKRPMDEWNAADQAELEEALRYKLEEMLNGIA